MAKNFNSNTTNKIATNENTAFSIPNTVGISVVYNTISNISNLNRYSSRIESISKGKTTTEVFTTSQTTGIEYKNENAEISLELKNIESLIESNKPTKKIFIYVMKLLGNQNITENLFNDLSLEFPLHNLVDIGMYKSLYTARKGFNIATDNLLTLIVNAKIKVKSKLKSVTDFKKRVLFIGADIENGICKIILNKDINWKSFALQQFTLLSTAYFCCSSNSSDLLYNICSLARQKGEEIRNNHYFNINLRNVQNWLALPNEKETKDPKGKIINKILESINEINEKACNDLEITIDYNKNGNTTEILNNGYISVFPKDDFFKKIIEITNKKESIKTKKEKLTEKAKIKYLEKQLLDKK